MQVVRDRAGAALPDPDVPVDGVSQLPEEGAPMTSLLTRLVCWFGHDWTRTGQFKTRCQRCGVESWRYW